MLFARIEPATGCRDVCGHHPQSRVWSSAFPLFSRSRVISVFLFNEVLQRGFVVLGIVLVLERVSCSERNSLYGSLQCSSKRSKQAQSVAVYGGLGFWGFRSLFYLFLVFVWFGRVGAVECSCRVEQLVVYLKENKVGEREREREMDAFRKQLDALMGANRNGDVLEVKRNYYDRDVCRLYLTGLCPHDLFQLTVSPFFRSCNLRLKDLDFCSTRRRFFHSILARTFSNFRN